MTHIVGMPPRRANKTSRRTARDPVERLRDSVVVGPEAAMEERPWGDWKHGKSLSPHQLSRLLKPYGVRSRNLRVGDKAGIKGYCMEDFSDAFTRYIPQTPLSIRYAATSRSQSGDPPLFQSATPQACRVSENASNPAPDAGCSVVADQHGDLGDALTIYEADPC